MIEVKSHIFIIIPCYNESTVIHQTVAPLVEAGYQVVVVNDGSSEDIFEKVQDLSVHYLKHPINLGQGAALQTGMDYALLNEADIVVHFDADGQHRIEDIENLIQPILNKEVDVVLGSRFLIKKHREAVPVMRRWLLQVAKMVNGLFTGLWLTDAHNGLRAFNKKATECVNITENHMAHATEILKLIKENKLTYCERPTHIVYTDYSKEKGQSALNSINILIDLIVNKLL